MAEITMERPSQNQLLRRNMKDLSELEKEAYRIQIDEAAKEQELNDNMDRLIPICARKLIPKPITKLLFFKLCPECGEKLTKHKYYGYSSSVKHFKCTKCDYEWASRTLNFY